MKPIWIVDDDHSIRFVLEKALAREQFTVRSFASAREVLSALDSDEPQVMVSDIRMPGGSGIDLLARVKARLPGLPVIIMTAYSDLDSAVSAFQGGAFEYLPKPFDVPKAVELIRRAVEESLREEVRDTAAAPMPEMLGQAPAMQDVFRAIGRLSQSTVTVMITGESGSGKELVARALHKHSPRGDQGNNGPFVAINTAAIPKDLLESERLAQGHGALQTERVDLAALVRETVAAQFPGREIALVLEDGIAPVTADPMRLKLLLRNLVDNALRHAPGAPQPPQVTLARGADGGLALSVRDYGPGVSDEQLAHLAQPFYRADPARQRR